MENSIGEQPLKVFSKDDFDSLMNSTLMFDLMLLEIPSDSKVYIMENGTKLYLHTILNDDMQMQDVEGVVIKKAKVPNVKIGDSVIFHYLSLNNGRDGCGERVFTFAYDKKLYHIIPYNQIFFSISDGVYSAHNNRYLVEGIDAELKIEIDGKIITGKQTSSGLVLVDLKSEPYKRDRCRIVAAPDGSTYKQGDIVMTNGAWDVPLKSDLMRGKSSQYFIAMEYNFLCHENFVECTT